MSGWVAGSVAASAVIGGISANKAADTQASAANRATDVQQQTFERQTELQEPFRQAGLSAQNKLLGYLGIGEGDGRYAKDFSMGDYQADPGYAFRLSEGMKALDRTAASRGGLLSGATLRGAQRYGQDLASQEYQNAFNRYQVNRANQLNPLQSLMGAGQTSANTLTSAAGNLGANIGSNIIGAGNARASSYIGGANALSSGVGQGLNFYQNQQYLNKLPNYGANINPYGYGDTSIYGPASVSSSTPPI